MLSAALGGDDPLDARPERSRPRRAHEPAALEPLQLAGAPPAVRMTPAKLFVQRLGGKTRIAGSHKQGEDPRSQVRARVVAELGHFVGVAGFNSVVTGALRPRPCTA